MDEMKDIKVIGVGGIGLCVLPVLCRYLNYHPEIDTADIHLIDGDEFEARNSERQQFVELGKKAEVTAKSLEEEYRNLVFHSHTDYLNEENVGWHVREEDIVFMGVDNHSTRKLVIEECMRKDDIILITGGNDYTTGDVSIYIREKGEDVTKSPIHVFPEIANPPEGDKNPADLEGRREGGCAVEVASAPQLLIANNLVAASMLAAFYAVVEGRQGDYGSVYIDILSNQIRQNNRAMPPKQAVRIA